MPGKKNASEREELGRKKLKKIGRRQIIEGRRKKVETIKRTGEETEDLKKEKEKKKMGSLRSRIRREGKGGLENEEGEGRKGGFGE
jgi:hypothetical protein